MWWNKQKSPSWLVWGRRSLHEHGVLLYIGRQRILLVQSCAWRKRWENFLNSYFHSTDVVLWAFFHKLLLRAAMLRGPKHEAGNGTLVALFCCDCHVEKKPKNWFPWVLPWHWKPNSAPSFGSVPRTSPLRGPGWWPLGMVWLVTSFLSRKL
jgi:hypothetical protein